MPILLEEVADRLRQHPRLIFADDFEINVESRRSRSSRYQNGQPVGESSNDGFLLSLRVLHRKAPGAAVVTAADDQSLNRLVEEAFHSARCSTGDPWFRFPLWKQVELEQLASQPPLPERSLWTGNVSDFAFIEEKYESCQSQIQMRRKSERFDLRGSGAVFSAQFSVGCSAANGVMLLREDRSNRHGADGMGAVLRTLTEDARAYAGAESAILKGKRSVVLAPAVASVLLSRLTPWFFSDLVRHRQSPLKGQDPKHIFSPVLTLVDVGNHPESPHSFAFDCEGTRSRETTLVERGALQNLLFNTYEATRENRLSTGNWLRAPGALWPSVRVSTCYFRPSQQTAEALLREAGSGVWLRRVESLDLLAEGSSRFILRGAGQLIEGGVAGPVRRGISLQFDAFELLRKAVGVGADLTLFGNHGSPSILFENVPLGEV